MTAKSTARRKSGKAKVSKPRFPLWHHKASGRWCKKIKDQFHYFELVADDPTGEQSLFEWNDLKNGRTPAQPTNSGHPITLRELVNTWIHHKKGLLECCELAQRTYDAYFSSASFLLDAIGKHKPVEQLGPDDFQRLRGRMARAWGPIRLKNEMGVVESIFRHGEKADLWQTRINFGPSWTKPKAKTLRKQRAKNGPRLFTSDQVLKLLKHSSTNMRAMIYLGLQSGMGNTDLALLPVNLARTSLEDGWLQYARNKTGIDRRIPLWNETREALQQVLAERRDPKDSDDRSLLFIGKRGESYVGNHRGYRVTQEFNRTAKRANVQGRTFYDFRRTFQTVGEGAGDLVAVRSLMGHADRSDDMSAIYRQTVSDERLKAVTEHVRGWLSPTTLEGGG